MSMGAIDPYSFAASRFPTDTRDAIRKFWMHFAANAEGLDRCFSSNMTEKTVDPTVVMAALKDVSPELMWEFGPSDRGHALTITAEWNDSNRALARAVHDMAPDLSRWQFHQVRGPESDSSITVDYFAQRFGEPLTLTKIEAICGETGRVNLIAHGPDNEQALADQALKVASAILGEAVERDWIGYIDGAPTAKTGLFGRLRGQSPAPFEPATFADGFRAAIARLKSALPARPYAGTPLDDREVTLFKAKAAYPEHPRADLITFAAASEAYGRAVLSGGRFSSRCHSIHDEWFLYLRIQRTEDAPFDDVSERGVIEERLHQALSQDGLGGVVAAGHGSEAVYIDLDVSDAARAVAQIGQVLQGEPYVGEATLHFLDQGLQSLVLPAAPDSLKPN